MSKNRTGSVHVKYAPNGRILAEHLFRVRKYAQVLIGPLGSAKTTNNIFKMLAMWEQAPIDPTDGVRRSRWAAVRNTYADLVGTTIKDFLEIADPMDIGHYSAADQGKGNPVFRAQYEGRDGRLVEAELNFLAFDTDDHVRKARGLRLSGAWFNELKELNKANVDMVMSRLKRFRPDLFNAQPECWYGMLGDSNAPDSDHWLAKLHEQWLAGRLNEWWFGIQPGAVISHDGGRYEINKSAENMSVVGEDYYRRQLEGKADSWVRQNLGNEFVFHADGRAIHPEFNQRIHVANYPLTPLPGIPLDLGTDFGRTPALAIAQQQPDGRLFVLSELVTDHKKGTSARPFGRRAHRYLSKNYPHFTYNNCCDPAGDQPGQGREETLIQLLEGTKDKPGIAGFPADTNDFDVRTEALDGWFRDMIDGKPSILIDSRCTYLIKGLSGAYQFRRLKVAGDERFHDRPDKGPYSHICEALHYLCMGLGSGKGLNQEEWGGEYAAVEQEYGGWHPPQHHFE